MKTAKKVTALLLAVVMVLAMSVSSFAATTGTATLTVSYGGEPLLVATVPSGQTAKAALDEHADELELTWKTVSNWNPGFGATAYVIDTIYGTGSVPVGADSGITAQFWSSQYPGYGIEYTEIINGKTLYHYIYVGNDWKFTVGGEKPKDLAHLDEDGNPYEYYLDQYTIADGDDIVIDYLEQTERWTSYDYWLTA